MIRIHIIAIDTGLEAHAVRYAAEYWGACVTVSWVGNSAQIVDFFASKPEHDLIIISGHGDEQGLALPELGTEIESNYPYKDVIRPEDFASFLQLTQNVVINTSCSGASESLAAAFLSKGAKCYVAPIDYPRGDASLMYVLSFLYEYIANGKNAELAHSSSGCFDDDRRQFRLFI